MLVRNLICQLAVHYFTSLFLGCYCLGPLSNQSDPNICCIYLCDVNCEAGSLYYYMYTMTIGARRCQGYPLWHLQLKTAHGPGHIWLRGRPGSSLEYPHPWKYASCGNVRSVTPKWITEAAAPRPEGRDDWDIFFCFHKY